MGTTGPNCAENVLCSYIEYETSGEGIHAAYAPQRERIKQAAQEAGRDPATICLIAVSKRQSVEKIRAAYAEGQRRFGENYVQELVQKAEELQDLSDIRWHMIGHLQSNKARLIAGLVERVHTVSSVKLAAELGRRVDLLAIVGPRIT